MARPPENSLRWRTNLARGDQARQYEAADAEVISRVLAFEVQAALDEYKRANPDFPVCARIRTPKRGGRHELSCAREIETGFREAARDADCD